jgi:hypothetical protein
VSKEGASQRRTAMSCMPHYCVVQAYDVAVARAVADTRVLAELCLPYVRPGGAWVAAKGPDPEVGGQHCSRCGGAGRRHVPPQPLHLHGNRHISRQRVCACRRAPVRWAGVRECAHTRRTSGEQGDAGLVLGWLAARQMHPPH